MEHEPGPSSVSTETLPGRRSFLQWLTFGAGVAAAAVLAVPFVSYLLGAVRKHQVKWVNLGPLSKFPLQETRLETFENPLRQPWDGMAAHTGVYVRNLGKDATEQQQF